ncbi:MAG: hypothetical protein ACD_8C00018G0002 [uncultured bacterium]|nr:MAG: hypothetical protein ACD_8C00018G0002 [uncultured bacterium]
MNKIKINSVRGFTLIELLIVIAIIGILAGIVLVSTSKARMKARDIKRIQEVSQIQTALEMYYAEYGAYPNSDGDGLGGWDIGNADYPFITQLANYLNRELPRDNTKNGTADGYVYYRYPAGHLGCPIARGNFYVLGTKLEGGASPNSPGWSCPGGDWQTVYGWVTGKFER